MFSNFKKRYCGDDWIVDCLDFVLNVKTEECNDEGEVTSIAYSPISQTSKNKLYQSEFLTSSEQVRIRDTFVDLASILAQIIDETSGKEQKKRLKRKSLIQNLFFMMYNGLTSYDQIKLAIDLHDKAYDDKTNFFCPNFSDNEEYNDLTFKNACEGARAVNMEFRHLQLNRIMSQVLGTELNKAFNL